MWTLYCSSVCFSSVLKRLVYRHYRKIGRKIGQETEIIICEAPPLKKSNGIKYITRRSPQILNTGTYRKIFGDFPLAQMGDCMGIFNHPSDFSLAMGDWESGSLYPCIKGSLHRISPWRHPKMGMLQLLVQSFWYPIENF